MLKCKKLLPYINPRYVQRNRMTDNFTETTLNSNDKDK